MTLTSTILSCQSRISGSEQNANSPLQRTNETLKIGIDKKTPNFSTSMAHYQSDKPYLININHIDNELQIYDLEAATLMKTLTFQKEGPEGVGKIFGFHIQSLDSIFLFPQAQGIVYLTDTTVSIKDKIHYQAPEGHTTAFVLPSYFSSQPIISNQKILVKTHAEGNHRQMDQETLSTKRLSYLIDLKSGNVQPSAHLYPSDYLAKGLKHFEFSFASSGEKIVYSFFADHHLYHAASPEQELKAKYRPSKYLEEDFEDFPADGNRQESMRYLAGSAHYKSILYDPYREVYYRFCYPKTEVDSEKALLQLRSFPNTFSIMILDQDLNVLGETLFENEMLVPDNAFVGKKGLYISINHPDNPENQEDYFSFALLTLREESR